VGDNDDDATVEASIGSGAQVKAQNLVVDATNTARKDLLGPDQHNVQAGSGGVIQGNASESETTISHATRAAIGAGAKVDVVGDASGNGTFRLNVFNDVEGYDDVRLDTGGLIVGSARPRASSPTASTARWRSATARS
jgi:hypothetical protein